MLKIKSILDYPKRRVFSYCIGFPTIQSLLASRKIPLKLPQRGFQGQKTLGLSAEIGQSQIKKLAIYPSCHSRYAPSFRAVAQKQLPKVSSDFECLENVIPNFVGWIWGLEKDSRHLILAYCVDKRSPICFDIGL